MSPYVFLRYLHSGFRYIVLLLLLLAIIQAWAGLLGRKPYTEGNRKLNLFTLISVHTQLLIGIGLYLAGKWYQNFSQMGGLSRPVRYWTAEHWTGMLLAIILITIGHSRAKRCTLSGDKHKSIAVFYTLGLLIIVVVILLSGRGLFGMTR